MISDKLSGLISQALKDQDQITLDTLRMISSAFNYEKINRQHELNDVEELEVLRREAKKRKEAIEFYDKALISSSRVNLESISNKLNREKKELEIISKFLPSEITDEELAKIVDEVLSKTGNSALMTGRIIGEVLRMVNGRADGNRVSSIVRSKVK